MAQLKQGGGGGRTWGSNPEGGAGPNKQGDASKSMRMSEAHERVWKVANDGSALASLEGLAKAGREARQPTQKREQAVPRGGTPPPPPAPRCARSQLAFLPGKTIEFYACCLGTRPLWRGAPQWCSHVRRNARRCVHVPAPCGGGIALELHATCRSNI